MLNVINNSTIKSNISNHNLTNNLNKIKYIFNSDSNIVNKMKSDIKQYNLKHNGIISDYKNNKFNDNKIVNKQLKHYLTKNSK